MAYSLVVVEKFKKNTDVRTIGTYATEQEAQKRMGETRWAGKRGQPYIIPAKEYETFYAQHYVPARAVPLLVCRAHVRTARDRVHTPRTASLRHHPLSRGDGKMALAHPAKAPTQRRR